MCHFIQDGKKKVVFGLDSLYFTQAQLQISREVLTVHSYSVVVWYHVKRKKPLPKKCVKKKLQELQARVSISAEMKRFWACLAIFGHFFDIFV